MIRIRSFCGGSPLPNLDVTTGSNRVAAQEAVRRSTAYGSWDDVSVNFNDGSRPMKGSELAKWVQRHFPDLRSDR